MEEEEEKIFDALSKRTSVAENLVKYVGGKLAEIESRRRNLDLVGESVVGRMMEIEFSFEKRLRDLEEREKRFDAYSEGKKRKLASAEEALSLKREEFLNEVKMREEELNERLEAVNEQSEWLDMAQNEVLSIRRWALEKLKEVEFQEQNLRSARQSLAEKEKKVDIVIGTLDERITAAEEREKKFDLYVEGKQRELLLRDEQLSMKWEGFLKEVKIAEEKFIKQEKLRHGFMERLELAENKLEGMRETIDERFKVIEFRENAAWELVATSAKEADLIRESMEKQLEEFEKLKSEFGSYHEDKMRELVEKKQQLSVMSEELVRDARLIDEQLTEREKLGHELLKRLESTKDKVEALKELVHERVREVRLKEIELNSIRDWVDEKMEEADSKAKELEEKEKIISMKEDGGISIEKELVEKEKTLDMKEKNLNYWQRELEVKQREVNSVQELNGQRLQNIERSEENLNSLKEFTRRCFKEHRDIKKKLRFERDLVKKRGRHLKHKVHQLKDTVRKLELKEKQMRDYVKELEWKQQLLTDALNAHVKMEPDESVDLKFVVRMDGKTLQMFLNDPDKDLELMGDEILQVLRLSSDPAKLVLDAMEGFCPPHLRIGDVEFNVRRTCIVLLEQLIKMSPKIKPSVQKEAIELASAWKSKMKATAENPLEVLGFLHLLAAYNLTLFFDKHETLRLLTMVASIDEHLSCVAFSVLQRALQNNPQKIEYCQGQSSRGE